MVPASLWQVIVSQLGLKFQCPQWWIVLHRWFQMLETVDLFINCLVWVLCPKTLKSLPAVVGCCFRTSDLKCWELLICLLTACFGSFAQRCWSVVACCWWLLKHAFELSSAAGDSDCCFFSLAHPCFCCEYNSFSFSHMHGKINQALNNPPPHPKHTHTHTYSVCFHYFKLIWFKKGFCCK